MSHEVRVLAEADLRRAVPLDLAAVDVVEGAFTALASGKVSPGFFDNPKIGLPSLNGLMILFSARTGLVEAMLMDNGYLTDVRTAAAGAVAARYLAPEVHTAGVIGTGVQARLQIEAAHLVRPFKRIQVWGRDPAKAAQCAVDIGSKLNIEAEVQTDPAALVAASQLVVTTTPAHEPVLRADWLHPGLHITAMGSDQAKKKRNRTCRAGRRRPLCLRPRQPVRGLR